LVRTRTTSERKTPSEVSSAPPTSAAATEAAAAANVEKCVNCQYYDRRRARPTDGKAPMWGQCRRHSPHLNPVTAKAYVVEGVWPLVRDDDWCGEWRELTRIIEEPLPETAAAPGEDARTASPSEDPRTAPSTRGRPEPATAGAIAAAGDD
jgi:hypothetical protein